MVIMSKQPAIGGATLGLDKLLTIVLEAEMKMSLIIFRSLYQIFCTSVTLLFIFEIFFLPTFGFLTTN